jgi:hypothetical protein
MLPEKFANGKRIEVRFRLADYPLELRHELAKALSLRIRAIAIIPTVVWVDPGTIAFAVDLDLD